MIFYAIGEKQSMYIKILLKPFLMLSETPYKYHIGKKQFIPITKGKGITDIVGTLLPINSTGEDCYLHDLEHIYKINSSLNELELIFFYLSNRHRVQFCFTRRERIAMDRQ